MLAQYGEDTDRSSPYCSDGKATWALDRRPESAHHDHPYFAHGMTFTAVFELLMRKLTAESDLLIAAGHRRCACCVRRTASFPTSPSIAWRRPCARPSSSN